MVSKFPATVFHFCLEDPSIRGSLAANFSVTRLPEAPLSTKALMRTGFGFPFSLVAKFTHTTGFKWRTFCSFFGLFWLRMRSRIEHISPPSSIALSIAWSISCSSASVISSKTAALFLAITSLKVKHSFRVCEFLDIFGKGICQ